MPYIKQELRDKLDGRLNELLGTINVVADEDTIEGILNYCITTLLDAIPAAEQSAWRYKHINRVEGLLGCVAKEFYRRKAGDYEDLAIEKNGDLPIYSGE